MLEERADVFRPAKYGRFHQSGNSIRILGVWVGTVFQ